MQAHTEGEHRSALGSLLNLLLREDAYELYVRPRPHSRRAILILMAYLVFTAHRI